MEKQQDFFHEATYTDQTGSPQTIKIPVVQELARKGLSHLPEKFIHNPPENLVFPATTYLNLPTIDLRKLRVGSDPDRAKEVEKLANGAKEWGMFLIKNHGVVLESVKEVVKGFFDLSFEEKKASVGSFRSVDNMGYGRNFVRNEQQPLDWIDRMSIVASPVDETNLYAWPNKPSNFKQVMQNYAEAVRSICNDLLQALAEALALERQVFLQQFEPQQKSELKIRVNYYPPCPRPDLAVGINPHSDASTLAVLIQFGACDGLQVFKDQKWITPIWPDDLLLVNIGDFMEIMSNGRLTSSWHRAVTQKNDERVSVAVFYTPPSDAEIVPVKNDDQENEMYKKVNLREYLENYYRVSPADTKEGLMYAKVQ